MKDLLLIILGIIAAIIILGLIAQTFWLSRIISIIFCALAIYSVCTNTSTADMEWVGYCSLAMIFGYSRYGMNPYKTGWVTVFKDGSELEEWTGGFVSTLILSPIIMALTYTFIASKFTFLLYAIPIFMLVMNIVYIVYKIVTGEELVEPDTWFKARK